MKIPEEAKVILCTFSVFALGVAFLFATIAAGTLVGEWVKEREHIQEMRWRAEERLQP